MQHFSLILALNLHIEVVQCLVNEEYKPKEQYKKEKSVEMWNTCENYYKWPSNWGCRDAKKIKGLMILFARLFYLPRKRFLKCSGRLKYSLLNKKNLLLFMITV